MTAVPDTDVLLDQAQQGDAEARQRLLTRHRDALRKMIQVRLDRRLLARLDPSDVIQEILLAADQKLDRYLEKRPIPFYPWLRQLAWEKLIELHQAHLRTRKRSVLREEMPVAALPDESVLELAERLLASGTSPSGNLLRKELRQRVREALAQLREKDREILVLRYLEQLSLREIAAIMGSTEGAIKVRHVRALDRLRKLLADDLKDLPP